MGYIVMSLKKIAALLLVLALLAAFAVGCADDSDPSGSTGDSENMSQSESGSDDATDASGETGDASDETSDGTETPGESGEPSSSGQDETTGTTGEGTESSTGGNGEPTEPHTHSYGQWTVTTQPTCTQPGSRSRSCACGEKQTEEVAATGHSYVNGVCSVCGKSQYGSSLRVINGFEVDALYHCSANAIVFKRNEQFYVADRNGKVVSEGYDSIKCASSDGYIVAYRFDYEVINSVPDEEYGSINTTRTTTDSFVLNESGKVIFQKRYVSEYTDFGDTTYEGENILSCNEGRIITCTSDTYHFATDHAAMTVNIYDMQGKRVAQFSNIRSVGTLMNGELILLSDDRDSAFNTRYMAVDKNGKLLRSRYGAALSFFPQSMWTTNGVVDGYMMLNDSQTDSCAWCTMLVSKDFSKFYKIQRSYLYDNTFCGTLVASRVMINGVLSEDYYLVDLSTCDTDSEGYCVPKLKDARSSQGYSYLYFSGIFGEKEPYVHVARGGRWGFLSYDGKTEKLYDDSAAFLNGVAVAMEGNEIYMIDKNFNRISNSITGYSSVGMCNGGVIRLQNGSRYAIALFS